MTAERHYSVLIGANDPFLRALIEKCVADHPWFEELASASTAVQTAQMAATFRPDVVILVDESPGLRGRDVLVDIEAALPPGRVILMSTADLPQLRALPAVSAAVPHRDGTALFEALTAFVKWMDQPTDYGTDRRSVRDRRVRQDWGQTFAQRRSSSRRADDFVSV
jgi:CheY-like chemotaxis protein